MQAQANSVSYPTIQDFAANAVGIAGKVELIWQPLYDYQIYPTAGLTVLPFFTVPQGSGNSAQPLAAAAVKSVADTNMILAGQLPAPQSFWVDGIEVVVDAGSTATANLFGNAVPEGFNAGMTAALPVNLNDYYIIAKTGTLVFSIMSKIYYQEGPLYRFPQRAAPRTDAASATTSGTVGTNWIALPRAGGVPVRFVPGYGIATGCNFNVQLLWPAVIATASLNARIGVTLNGWLFRAAQ